ncbi:MAG TPA: hypothetical protein VGO52_06625 [Hyphomonadaceae bacterium]|jgi:hypothetical protein|nr:hypothetical protein [Hyphomonadaceae bacterium]
MLRKSILLGLALLVAAPAISPAFAQGRGRGGNDHHDNRGGNDHRNDNRGPGNRGGNDRHDNRPDNRNNNRGGDWNRGNNRGDNDWNRNNNWSWNNNRHDDYRRYDRNRTSLSLGFIFGSPGYAGYSPYNDNYSYREPAYYNSYGLAPGQCRWDREYAYWRGRPADVELQRCADGYGNVYVVQQSTRLWRYR